MSGSPQIRVVLVDDHPLVREWLSNLLHQHADLKVCGEAENQGDALRLIEDTAPQIAVVDISLGQGSGLDFIKVIKSRFPSLIVLVLSMHDEAIYAERVIRAGARGYVMKKNRQKKLWRQFAMLRLENCILARM